MKTTLGTLRDCVVDILVEGRVDDAREKYPDMEEEDFDYLVANQPAGSNNKYLMWACAQAETLLQDDPDRQALSIVIQAVRLFDGTQQRLKKRDINQYKDVAEIEAAVAEVGKSKGEKAREVRSDTDTIYQDDRFIVVRPHTTEASCKYGTGTKWCIAATGSYNYFNSYSTNNNKFYFVIDKQAPANAASSKYAIAIIDTSTTAGERTQVYDATDRLVNMSVVAQHVGSKWPTILEKIQSHVAANPSTREVEEAKKATEEHVKNLLAGKPITDIGAKKIAADGTLTTPVVKALIKRFDGYTGPTDYRDARMDVVGMLANRIEHMPPEAAMMTIKWTASMRPDNVSYWNGNYYLERMFKHANLTPDDFRTLAQTKLESILAMIITNPNVPSDLLDSIGADVQKFKDYDNQRKAYSAMIKSGHITPDQFRNALTTHSSLLNQVINAGEENKLSSDLLRMIPINEPWTLKRALKIPNFPPDYAGKLIKQLLIRLDRNDVHDILKSTKISLDSVDELWKEGGQDVKTALLQNPSIGAQNASKFALSKNSAYRFAVAHNPATPQEDLDVLATDESVSTRAAVGANHNTSYDTLMKLAGDEAIAVRAGVASNILAPRNVLELLKKDSDEFVRKAVRKNLKSLEKIEARERTTTGMRSLLREELEDEDMQDIMTPNLRQISDAWITLRDFVVIFLLQNNGSATKEEIEAEFGVWPSKPRFVGYGRSRRAVADKDLWSLIRSYEKDSDRITPSRSTNSSGRGWWWAPAGINKGSLLRLTPTGAARAMTILKSLQQRQDANWTTKEAVPVKKSPPPPGLGSRRNDRTRPTPAAPAAPRGPKTTYKIYGKFKGHPVATRLKGQAYVGAADTLFTGGEQAVISPEDGKLRVKKADGDHSQLWEPIDG